MIKINKYSRQQGRIALPSLVKSSSVVTVFYYFFPANFIAMTCRPIGDIFILYTLITTNNLEEIIQN